jgi:hypothetical protein
MIFFKKIVLFKEFVPRDGAAKVVFGKVFLSQDCEGLLINVNSIH